jgi:ATP-binding cassette subfamily B protein
MKLLWEYLKNYKKLLLSALVLATINQVFSLLDPQIFRYLIDNYATKIGQITQSEFVQGVLILLLGTMGVAFVSRIAKNFQDYYVNVITQKLGAKMYNHSVEHSFSLPFAVFEDQRSGEFLNKLQKARTDSQALIQPSSTSRTHQQRTSLQTRLQLAQPAPLQSQALEHSPRHRSRLVRFQDS